MKKKIRELLLDSAFQLFSKEGFQGANIATFLSDVDKERIEQKIVMKYFK